MPSTVEGRPQRLYASVCDLRTMEGHQRGGVVEVGGNARERYYDSSGYGRPDGDGVVLSVVEAAHLLYRDDLAAVDGRDFGVGRQEAPEVPAVDGIEVVAVQQVGGLDDRQDDPVAAGPAVAAGVVVPLAGVCAHFDDAVGQVALHRSEFAAAGV